jgi:putative peptidoglycan lipid II flippase
LGWSWLARLILAGRRGKTAPFRGRDGSQAHPAGVYYGMRLWKSRQHMGLAAVIMAVSILLSRVMGLVRDKVISYIFGATGESDLYFAAFVIPDFINYLIAGGYFSITLIPLLAHYFDEDTDEGWRFFSTVFTWVTVVIVSLTGLAMLLAPQLAHLAAPGLAAAALPRLAYFLRLILPAQVFFLMGSCCTALLYLRKQFLAPALTPLVYNGMIIVVGVLLRGQGMAGFCWGVLVGAFLGNLLIPYLAVRHGGGLRLHVRWWHPGLSRFCVVALPLMVGQSIVVLDEQLVRVFGSLAGVGAISWLSYARRIMMVPVGVVAQAVGVASYPFLAELAARGDRERFQSTVNTALRNLLTLLIPLSVWMMVVAEPSIRLIFQQGRFTAADTLRTALVLRVFLAVVFCWGMHQLIGRAFYAHQDTLSPAVIGTLASLVSLPVFYLLARRFQATGVAAASALSILAYTVALALWWRRRHGAGVFASLAGAGLRLVLLAVLAAVPGVLAVRSEAFLGGDRPLLGAAYAILVSAAAFGVPFVLLASRLAPDLIRPYLERLGPLGRRLLR